MTDDKYLDYLARIACIDLTPEEACRLQIEVSCLRYFEQTAGEPDHPTKDAPALVLSGLPPMLSRVKPDQEAFEKRLAELEATRKVNRRRLKRMRELAGRLSDAVPDSLDGHKRE